MSGSRFTDAQIIGVLNSADVGAATAEFCRARGLPELITVDNGPEFAGRTLDAWAYAHGMHLHFIDPGKPVQNAYIESFNGRLRDEADTFNALVTDFLKR